MKFFRNATLDPDVINARGLAAFDEAIQDLDTAANLYQEEALSADDQAVYFSGLTIDLAAKAAQARTVAARLRELTS